MKKIHVTLLAAGAACLALPAWAEPAGQGQQVFSHWCAACHAPDPRAPGTAALAAKYGATEPAPLEQRTDLAPDVVKFFVRHGVSIMPPFRKTEITDAELDALADYLGHKSTAATK